MNESWKVNGTITAVTFAVWVATFLMHNHFLAFLTHAPGIDLLFVPSGVRLIAIMIGGIWAALGICLGSLLLAGPEFQTGNVGIILAVALGSGLFPYLALKLSLRIAGVAPDLGNLSPLHLPVISLGVAIGSSLLHNLLFSVLGLAPWPAFADHVTAMAAGDFLGALVAVVIIFAFLKLFRRSVA